MNTFVVSRTLTCMGAAAATISIFAGLSWIQRSRLKRAWQKLQDERYFISALRIISGFYHGQVLGAENEVIKGRFLEEIPNENREPIPLSVGKIWDFKLGDTVRIKHSLVDFMSIQDRTIGYHYQSEAALGRVGIVTYVYSKYANLVGVYFPEMKVIIEIYPGALEHVENELPSSACGRWKVGDFVKSIDYNKLLSIMQTASSIACCLPKECFGKRGRVVASFENFTAVDFGGICTYNLFESTLLPCTDQTAIERKKILHPRGFTIGDKVWIISDLKALIDNQKGAWSDVMSRLQGQEVTVIYIFEDGDLVVQLKHEKPWKINPNSVRREHEWDTTSKVTQFVPGDIVEFDLSTYFRRIFARLYLRPKGFEITQICWEIHAVSSNFFVIIKLADISFVQLHPAILKKVSAEKTLRFRLMKNQMDNLTVGDNVRLDVGPLNLVRSILDATTVNPEVYAALTKAAKLVCFVDAKIAIIDFGNGARYKVWKGLLTMPNRYENNVENNPIHGDVIEKIQDMVAQGIVALDSEGSVQLQCVFAGCPPYMELKINSDKVTLQELVNWVKDNSSWHVSVISNEDGHLMLRRIEDFEGQVILGVVSPTNQLGKALNQELSTELAFLFDAFKCLFGDGYIPRGLQQQPMPECPGENFQGLRDQKNTQNIFNLNGAKVGKLNINNNTLASASTSQGTNVNVNIQSDF